jgi:hypothetical protein
MINFIFSTKKTYVNDQIILEHVMRSIKIVFKLTDLANFKA